MSTSTPSSATSTPAAAPAHVGSNSSSATTSKPRKACDHCRASKSKCESVPGNERGACQRCSKTSRMCVFGQRQQRKVMKRPSGAIGSGSGGGGTQARTEAGDDKVERLERKLEVLEASLSMRQMSVDDALIEEYDDDDDDDIDDSQHGGESSQLGEPETPPAFFGNPQFFYQGVKDAGFAVDASTCPKRETITHVDIITRGEISMEVATGLYRHFITNLLPHFPFYIAPKSMLQCRSHYPVLFIAALAGSAGTGAATSAVHHTLLDEVYRLLADKIIYAGEKSVELCQALMITATWHHPCAGAQDSRIWMLVHQAAVMALDLECTAKPLRARTGPLGRTLSDDEQLEMEIEEKRTLLTCYMSATSVAVILRRPMMRFGNTVQNAIEALSKTHPKRVQRDLVLVNLAEVMNLMADTAGGCGLFDGDSESRPATTAIAFVLETFEKRLVQINNDLNANMATSMARNPSPAPGRPALGLSKTAQETAFSVANSGITLKMFSIILEENHMKSLDRSFFTQACGNLLSSSHHILNVFCNSPTAVLATSPWQVYSRAGGAASILLRMAQIDGTVPIPHLKIREYLGKLAEKLNEILQKYRIRAVALTLSLVNTMLKWYFENIDPKLRAEHQAVQTQPPPPPPPPQQQQQQQQQQQTQPHLQHHPHPQPEYQQQQHHQHVQLSPSRLPPQVSTPPHHQQYAHPMHHQQMHYSQHSSPADTADITMHAAPQLNVWEHEAVHQEWSEGGFDITPHEISSFLQGTDGQMMFGPVGSMMHFQAGGDGSGGGGGGGQYWQ